MYILSRNSLLQSGQRLIEDRLLPIIKEKHEYLHGEGVAQTVYALE